jgi:hypothetical protein
MKKVWKCDFCTYTHNLDGDVKLHEDSCIFNPINKHCYSCKNYNDFNHYGDYHPVYCTQHNTYSKCENCEDWETDDEKLLRKLKLQKLYENK